jgi:uncharacterized protein (TIGR03435 family)
MINFPRLLFALLIASFWPGTTQAETPKIGQDAPSIKLKSLLQISGSYEQNMNFLQGKVVVLEFWATWCAPCIASMPHLNQLSEKYKAKGIQFISITDETDAKVVSFLKKRKINGWIGLDTDRAMHEAYQVETIPFTVVIGANGKVLGYPQSKMLSEQMLDEALAGKVLSTTEALSAAAPPAFETIKVSESIYELSIRQSTLNGTASKIGPSNFSIKGATALLVLKMAFDAALKQTEINTSLPEGQFDVVATNPTKGSPDWAWRDQLQHMLQEVWGLRVQSAQKELDVYEMHVTPVAEKLLVKVKPGWSSQASDEGVLTGRGIPMNRLANAIQEAMSTPIFDATNLSGNYDYNLYYDAAKPETLSKSLEDEMGLTLRKTKRLMDVLVIAPKE